MEKNQKRVWIFRISIVVLSLSLAFCISLLGEIKNDVDIQENMIEVLQKSVVNSKEQLVKEHSYKITILDSLQKLGEEYLVLEKKDSLSNIKFSLEVQRLKKELRNVTNDELSNLMIETYENVDSTNFYN